ncbi:hypothetical protein DJ568_14890 [Mucilaginibacter hurinus]|uniref:Uncharacterized protein n=1 Tax=Mucilaginibacter hurinus TaxID=2201324 RepID=A0A367GLF7_9SPHI|nr:hypothetical protein DJ568_14890 [Mucilaginibacter hurinus]
MGGQFATESPGQLLRIIQLELQFDIKKIPGEVGPCYMVTVDGLFQGYIKKEKSGMFRQLMNSNFTNEDMAVINYELKKIS